LKHTAKSAPNETRHLRKPRLSVDNFFRAPVHLSASEDPEMCEYLAEVRGRERGRRIRQLLRAGFAVMRAEYGARAAPDNPKQRPVTAGPASPSASLKAYDTWGLNPGDFDFTRET
jgi:hypothetical protein